MRSQHISMTWQEYELQPMKLGWKYEYWDGQTHISPRHTVVTVTVRVQPRTANTPHTIRPVLPPDEPELIAAYIAAYSDTIDFCDWQADQIEAAAQKDIPNFFIAKRGAPLPASCVAVAPHPETGAPRVIGAALIIAQEEQPPLLDMLFVLPEFHRQGIATTLASTALNILHQSGVETLASRYALGNEESRAWHQRFGFVEELDVTLARLYYRHAQHELQRRQQIGDLTEQDRELLTAECQRWHDRVEELEAIADRDGVEAVMPGLRWR
jgi:GNAT superfamily N-acetyltransferase